MADPSVRLEENGWMLLLAGGIEVYRTPRCLDLIDQSERLLVGGL